MYLEDARKQHYYFVHRYLRDKVATSPALAVRDLEDEKSIQYLKAMWARIALESINFNEELIPPDGLEIHLFNIGETHRAVIVKFPEPKGPPEAFMVAIVIPAGAKPGDECKGRYLTLELSPGRPNRTVFCEWSGSDMHLNRGAGPPPSVDEFRSLVIDDIEGSRENPDFTGISLF